MRSERFRPLLTSHGPYGSVYFEDSHDTEDARAQIELMWRGLREQLARQGAKPALTASLEQAIIETNPSVGAVDGRLSLPRRVCSLMST